MQYRRSGSKLSRVFDVVAVVVGDRRCVAVRVGCGAAVTFLRAAGDRFVATYFRFCFLLFLPLVFLLALLERSCHRFIRVCRRRRREKRIGVHHQYDRSRAAGAVYYVNQRGAVVAMIKAM